MMPEAPDTLPSAITEHLSALDSEYMARAWPDDGVDLEHETYDSETGIYCSWEES